MKNKITGFAGIEIILLVVIFIGIASATKLALENQNLQKLASTSVTDSAGGGSSGGGDCSSVDCPAGSHCAIRGSKRVPVCIKDRGGTSGGTGTLNSPLVCDCYNAARTACRKCPDGGGGGGGGNNNSAVPPTAASPTPKYSGKECSFESEDINCQPPKKVGDACLNTYCQNPNNIAVDENGVLKPLCTCGTPTPPPPAPPDIPSGNIEVALTVELPADSGSQRLFETARIYVKETATNNQKSRESSYDELLNSAVQKYLFENLCPDCKHDIWVQLVDANGTNIQYNGQSVTGKITIGGIEDPYPCETCQLTPIEINNKVEFAIDLKEVSQNLSGQKANDSILEVMGQFFKGLVDRVNFLKFFGSLRDVPGLKKSTCDPTVPPYCKPVY